MKIPRLGPLGISQGVVWVCVANIWMPHTLVWRAPLCVAVFGWLGLVLHSVLTDDPQVKAKKLEEERVRHIRALEKELGFTPLELGDPTAPEKEQR